MLGGGPERYTEVIGNLLDNTIPRLCDAMKISRRLNSTVRTRRAQSRRAYGSSGVDCQDP